MVHALMLATILLTGEPNAAKVEIERLVQRLGAPQFAEREAAEAELLRRGPAILDVLPPPEEQASAEVRQRLTRVRQKLQQAAAESTAQGSTITLHADAMPLSQILATLERQSGNAIVDAREKDAREKSGHALADPQLRVDFDKELFWPALDRVLDQAGMSLRPSSPHSSLEVIALPHEKPAARFGNACYRGPFRFEATSALARRPSNQATDGALIVGIEVAWEPRLRMICLMQRMADVTALDERGNPIAAANRDAQLEMPASGRAAVKFDLPLRLPPHGARRIASLNATLTATFAGKSEIFRFSGLSDAKNVAQRIAGVNVTLEEVRKTRDGCDVCILVRFDDAGDALASHRTWIFDNEAYLEGPDGKRIAYANYDTTKQGENEVGLCYSFAAPLPLDNLSFVYKTPGLILSRSIRYELKNIASP